MFLNGFNEHEHWNQDVFKWLQWTRTLESSLFKAVSILYLQINGINVSKIFGGFKRYFIEIFDVKWCVGIKQYLNKIFLFKLKRDKVVKVLFAAVLLC
jgi:hypothetical protein